MLLDLLEASWRKLLLLLIAFLVLVAAVFGSLLYLDHRLDQRSPPQVTKLTLSAKNCTVAASILTTARRRDVAAGGRAFSLYCLSARAYPTLQDVSQAIIQSKDYSKLYIGQYAGVTFRDYPRKTSMQGVWKRFRGGWIGYSIEFKGLPTKQELKLNPILNILLSTTKGSVRSHPQYSRSLF